MKISDFRSDTVTQPTEGMLKAMLKAPLGDDVLEGDPTVRKLEQTLAERFGMEAGLFCPSGTMTNQIAIKAHTKPGDELICSKMAHIYNYEGGGIAFNSGVQVRVGGDELGHLTAEEVKSLLTDPHNVHSAPTSLISMENTSNKGGGTCMDFSELQKIRRVANEHGLGYHLDGARLYHALVAKGETETQYGKLFDSISICLSKGLGCPVGSVLLGSKDFITEARRIRKRFGGAMRQAGFLAGAGLYALEHHVDRLREDHQLAGALAQILENHPAVEAVKPAETNLVIFKLKEPRGAAFIEHMKNHGIHLIAMDANWLRFVTHLQVNEEDLRRVERAIEELKSR